MKLLAIRIVASNFSGFSRSSRTMMSVFLLLAAKSLIFAGLNEKNADSDPETILESKSKPARTTNPRMIPIVGGAKEICGQRIGSIKQSEIGCSYYFDETY